MAIKLKNWTARRSVKICCVILIPIMAFLTLFGVIGILQMDNFYMELLFADLNKNDFFYTSYVSSALHQVQTLFHYQDEENIRNMGCLEWQLNYGYRYDSDGREIKEQQYELWEYNIDYGRRQLGSTFILDLESPEAKHLVEEAINSQLSAYLTIKKSLQAREGLYYFITDGIRELSNLTQKQDVDFFLGQPVFLILEKGGVSHFSSQLKSGGYGGPWIYKNLEDVTCSIAFSKKAVEDMNSLWKFTQKQAYSHIGLITASFIVMLVLLIILIAGAGRRYGDNDIHFTLLDKPWLDFGLALLIVYEYVVCVLSYIMMESAWLLNNKQGMIFFGAIFSLLFTLPLLWWLTSFAKRCKNGKFWRYSLIYVICSKLKHFAKSLWAGFPLTSRAVLIGVAFFVVVLICIASDTTWAVLLFCLVITALTVFGLLRYARKLYLLEQGAKAAGSGIYDPPIEVRGGELGSIAASINSIAGGINAAVHERLKSERLKTELLTNVSHDIRTPLTSLITYSDLLKNEGLDSAKAPEYLDILIQKSARLKSLTDDLFEAAKAASGNIEVKIDDLDLADFLRQVVGELDERVKGSGLDFRLNLSEHAKVRADGKLLLRVMENLLANVFKYALSGSRVYIDIMPEDGCYRLDIKNISEHPLNLEPAELTERFKRGDSARGGEGSGLGLSIAQSFTQLQGGRFNISIDGDLFKVSLYLPISSSLSK